MPRSTRSGPEPSLPSGARASRFTADGEEYLVLSYPLGKIRIPDSLTPAERDVAEAFVRGSSMREIATRRRTTRNTVANQLRSIYAKLGVGSRIELARVVIR